MKIFPVQNENLKSNHIKFTANYKSPKLKFERDDFFVKISGYGKNCEWADKVIKIADEATINIREKSSPESILHFITKGIKKVNEVLTDTYKSQNTGILRTKRDGWECKPDVAYTRYVNSRYSSYADRLHEVCTYPLVETPDKLAISRPVYYFEIEHGSSEDINNSLNYIFDSFKKIFPKYLLQDLKPENLNEVNSTIAEIRWVLAHATPWQRGSDAISNVFMRSMYKAAGIKTYPLSKGGIFRFRSLLYRASRIHKKVPEIF